MTNIFSQKVRLETLSNGAPASNESSNLYVQDYAEVIVTTEQLANLYESGPLEIIPAPGDGYINVLQGVALTLDEGGTIFNEDFQYSNIALIYDSENKPVLASSEGSFFTAYEDSRFTYSSPRLTNTDHAYVYNSECVNKPISLYTRYVLTATGGDTRLRVHVWYTTIKSVF